ncbi:MAG: hypothetical protein AAF182_01585 [Pseudomonadota bacterium]
MFNNLTLVAILVGFLLVDGPSGCKPTGHGGWYNPLPQSVPDWQGYWDTSIPFKINL